MNFGKFLRTPISTEHLWWLVLYLGTCEISLDRFSTSIQQLLVVNCFNENASLLLFDGIFNTLLKYELQK